MGAVIAGSESRTSSDVFIRMSVVAMPGLADRRTSRANHAR